MDIYYEVVGEGFPIICLHGNGEDHHIFDDLKERLSLTYQLILIDSRYHGKSICQGELSYEQMVEDVKKVVDELHITAYDVIGFSDGAIVSLLLGMQDSTLETYCINRSKYETSNDKTVLPIYISSTKNFLICFCFV